MKLVNLEKVAFEENINGRSEQVFKTTVFAGAARRR